MSMLSNKPFEAIPTYSLKQVTRNYATDFQIKDLDGDTSQLPPVLLTPHRRDYYALLFVKQGSSRHWVDMSAYTLKPDHVYFFTPQQVHLQEEAEPLLGQVVSFTGEFLLANEGKDLSRLPVMANPLGGHELALQQNDVQYINAELAKLTYEFRHGNEWRDEMMLAHLKVLLLYLSRLYNLQFKEGLLSDERALLNKYRTLIHEHYREYHQVADYADLLNISPGHLGKLVRSYNGQSAIGLIHERLVLEAKRLLFHTEHSIKEIAFELGFEDASYFNRFFKKATACTPAEYRDRMKAK